MKKNFQIIFISVAAVSTLASIAFIILNNNSVIGNLGTLISSSIVFLFSIFFALSSMFVTKTPGKIYASIGGFLLTLYSVFIILTQTNIINLPEEDTIDNWVNADITSAMDWASGNNIEIVQTYEYSDVVEAYHIISQNIIAGTLTDEVEKIEFIISLGPNYDKEVIVQSLLGWNIDELVDYIDSNFLNNVTINYELSSETKDTVINQDKSGTIRRSDAITITMSLGNKADLTSAELIDFTNMSLFDSTLWLKRNGISYSISYEFSDTIERHNVISQGTASGTIVAPLSTKVNLVVSKGKEIIVPDILSMTIEEVTNWVINNKLQINFSDAYDDTVSLGGIISSNRKSGDKLQEGDVIKIVTSKGQLKMEEFANLSDFRNWAAKYNISYDEEYEFNKDLASGKIISLSKEKGAIIKNGETIKVVVSQGSPVTIPNFYNMSWTAIKSKCNSLGLSCSYSYGDYSTSISKDYAYKQSKTAGSEVVSGTSVKVTLSKGKATSWTLVLQDSWYSYGNPTQTIANLKTQLAKYSGVTFKYVLVAANGKTSGLPHDSSPTKTGTTIKQGNTYEIWIVK